MVNETYVIERNKYFTASLYVAFDVLNMDHLVAWLPWRLRFVDLSSTPTNKSRSIIPV